MASKSKQNKITRPQFPSDSSGIVVHISGGLGPDSGGARSTIPWSVDALRSRGVDARLVSVSSQHDELPAQLKKRLSFKRIASLPTWREILLPELHQELERATEDADILHVHGLWSPLLLAACAIGRRRRMPVILSPMGMVSSHALAQSRWKKLIFSWLLQNRALSHVSCIHVTSSAEFRDSKQYFGDVPVALIPHGVELPVAGEGRINRLPKAEAGRTILFLGRVSPIKNIAALIEAWARVEPAYPSAVLRIVGPQDKDYATSLVKLAEHFELKRIFFEPPVDDEGRFAAFGQADVVVLPSHSESFGMSVAEALAFGRPVIVSDNTPWANLVDQARCGWTAKGSPEDLAKAIAAALEKPKDELRDMGQAAQQFIEELDLTWVRNASQLQEVYQWCFGRSPQPKCVYAGDDVGEF